MSSLHSQNLFISALCLGHTLTGHRPGKDLSGPSLGNIALGNVSKGLECGGGVCSGVSILFPMQQQIEAAPSSPYHLTMTIKSHPGMLGCLIL